MKLLSKFCASMVLALGLIAGYSALSPVTGQGSAYAQSAKSVIDAAKARGEVGEQIDGYLGVVAGKSASTAVQSAVREINIGRKQVYSQRARQENVSVDAIAASTGVKQLQKARPGETVRDASGQWRKK